MNLNNRRNVTLWINKLFLSLILLTNSIYLFAMDIPESVNVDLKGMSSDFVKKIEEIKSKIRKFPADGDVKVLAEIYGNLGMHYQSTQLKDAASESYKIAVGNDPENAQWLYLWGLIFQQKGHLDDAEVALRRSYELKSDYLATLAHLGEIYIKKSDWGQVKRVFTLLYKQEKYEAISAEALGQVAFEEGQFTKAIEYFKEALSRQPQANRIYYFLAQSYKKLGDKQLAKESLEKRGEVGPFFYDPLSAYVDSLNNTARKMFIKGFESSKKGLYVEALEYYNQGLKLSPKDVELLTAIGLVNEYLGNDEEAITFYKKALNINKEDGNALYNLGVLYEITGEINNARELYNQLLITQKDNVNALVSLSDLEFRKKNYSIASKLFAMLQKLSPNISQIKIYRAVSLLASGNCPWGRNILDEGIKVEPTNGNIALLLSATLAQCSDDEGLKKARALVNQVYSSAPSFQSARFAAYVLAFVGNFEDAIVLQEQAMFEALKNGGLEQYPDLSVNMKRYREGKKPDWNWQAYAIEIAKPVPSRKGK